MDDLVEVQDESNYCTSLLILPTELLVMILSYLSIRDIISMQFVSQRFKEISEIPSLWKKFVWPDNEPYHVDPVFHFRKESVIGVYFNSKCYTPAYILEEVHYYSNMRLVILTRNIQLSLDHLEEIVHTLSHPKELDVFASSIKWDPSYHVHVNQLLEATASVKKLILRLDWPFYFVVREFLCNLEILLKSGCPLPSVIDLFIYKDDVHASGDILESWSASSYTIAPLEIGLYDIARVPMDLYPSIPLRKFQFGPAAKPPLIKLSDHGILGLDNDIFYLNNYEHYGKVRLSVSPCWNAVKDEHLRCISNFNSVSNVDFSSVNINPGHLEQLAIACPNLERLNLMNVQSCLQSLQGLRAIVNTCQNLQGLNLVGTTVSSMESYLLLWELLSSIKKLTHLAINLCMLIHINSNCYNAAGKDKLIGMLGNCRSLKALETIQTLNCLECQNVLSVNDLLFSHFPSLVYVRLCHVQCITALEYTITNCRQLKYLYCEADLCSAVHAILPSSSNCHLQQLCIKSYTISLSAPSVQVLSAHGGLEQVILFVKSITTSAITTLIRNSPNLILLYIVTIETLCDDNGASVDQEDYKDTISKRFCYHELMTTGDFILAESCYWRFLSKMLAHFVTNLNSF